MLYFVRVEPLRRDVKADEIKDLLRDFGTIYRVVVHRASPFPRYNRISKQKDIFDATYAIVSYTDRHASLMAISNLDNTLYAHNLCTIKPPFFQEASVYQAVLPDCRSGEDGRNGSPSSDPYSRARASVPASAVGQPPCIKKTLWQFIRVL